MSAGSAKLAKNLLDGVQRAFPRNHEYRQVDGSEFRHVNQNFYSQTCRSLADVGFRLLGDIEDVTLKRTKPDMRTFLRLMTDADNTTVAAYYYLAPKVIWRPVLWMLRVPKKVVDFESYSGIEYTHCTTVAPASTTLPRPETMTKSCLPPKTSAVDLYRHHRLAIASLPRPLKAIRTVGEAIDQQVAQHAQLRRHFESIGWITKDYLRTCGAAATMVDDVYDEVQRLVQSGYEANA